MKIIVPMAGRGSRLRPHTLTIPKPLVPVAGKPIVHRLVEDIAGVCEEPIEEIAYVIGRFGEEVEKELIAVAESLGAKGTIYYQDQALGTAHAVWCASKSLDGNVIVAFADTLFRADFTLDTSVDGIIWVKQIEDPSSFGVVQLNDDGTITDFVEKPQEFVSDLAIIGIYYFKDGKQLQSELQYLIDNKVIKKGEYQLTDVLENMKKKGVRFKPGEVLDWMDCGNKNVTVDTNRRVLEHHKDEDWVSGNITKENTVIIPPCYIGDEVTIRNSIIGPYVSIGRGTTIVNSVIRDSIIQQSSKLNGVHAENSMIGNHAEVYRKAEDLSVGDYNQLK